MKIITLIAVFCLFFVSYAYAEVLKAPVVKIPTIQEKVLATFKDPRMVAILTCESGLKQYRGNGIPKVSGTSDVGIAQINQVWWQKALDLGYDIFFSEDDNLKMAKIIYDKQGISGWTCSRLVNDD
jgi:hypothetical protein